MYQLFKEPITGVVVCVIRAFDKASIPFDPDNTDYQQFKKDVIQGAELQDADGNVMTPDEAMAFISNLP